MADLIQEQDLDIRSSIGAGFFIRALDDENHSVKVPADLFYGDRYMGLAITTTDPVTPQVGDWWSCDETGVFVNFDNQSANKFDRFYYNGTTWDLVSFSDLWGSDITYFTVKDVDPATLSNPATGFYFMGIYGSNLWIKTSAGVISYLGSNIATEEFIAATDGQTAFTLARGIGPSSAIFHNGSLLANAGWSITTLTLRLVGPAYRDDVIKVIY